MNIVINKTSCDLLPAFGGYPLDVNGMELHIEGHSVMVMVMVMLVTVDGR